jgi:release factor H-coupled RctB family protein
MLIRGDSFPCDTFFFFEVHTGSRSLGQAVLRLASDAKRCSARAPSADAASATDPLAQAGAKHGTDSDISVHDQERTSGSLSDKSAGQTIQTLRIDEDSSDAVNSYLRLHDFAVRWASANRDAVAHRICYEYLFPGAVLDQACNDSVQSLKAFEVVHNFVERLPKNDPASDIQGPSQWIHRKGANPTSHSRLIAVPGSRGDRTYYCRPLTSDPDALERQRASAHSIAHGAGRCCSRAKALEKGKSWSHREGSSHNLRQTKFGGVVVCDDNVSEHECLE